MSDRTKFLAWKDGNFQELTKGIFLEDTKQRFKEIIDQLKAKGAQAVIFGCTEIPMLINEDELDMAVFDTTEIHVKSAVDFALS